jgi:hypothetical protein
VATANSPVSLSWTASTDNVAVTGYRVYRDGALVASPASTSVSITGLSASTLYSFTVSAVDAAGNTSAQSAGASATTQAIPVSPPPPPTGTVGPTITTFTRSGPITLISGQTVTGLSISNPNGPCIQGSGVSNVHIYNNMIGPCASTASGVGINLAGARDITIDHNSFDDVASGLYAANSTNNIVFDHNSATRIRGPMPRGQLVQFNGVSGSGHKIACNVSDQTSPGYAAGPEDHINMYKSSGTAASPILIQYNKLRGGGPSQSGGGILAGDEGSSYTIVNTNILVNPGQYGISIAGGHDNRMLNNKVYSASFAWTNIGAFVWNQYAPACSAIEVSGNRVNWTNRGGVANNWWDAGNCGTVTMITNLFGDPTIGASIWNETFPQCN